MIRYIVQCGEYYGNFSTDGVRERAFVVRQVTWEAGVGGLKVASKFVTVEQAQHAIRQVVGVDAPMSVIEIDFKR